MDRPRHKEDPSKNFVSCVVGDIRYALPIGERPPAVREIVNPLALVELPNAPPSVIGVADYRDLVIPVVSLRDRFGLPHMPTTRRTKWVVVEAQDRMVALVVDAVTEVFRSVSMRPAPSLGMGDDTRGIEGVTEKQGALVFVLDISRFAKLVAPMSPPSPALVAKGASSR